ncbi:DUF2252 family protein [Ferruginibacter albus]|uniref:DUF2252 family protein n=1 Tax=Ferruginibacter albus TaxID=2875540 RepID=UPI001CC58F39|nr:DUF2252 family protein [Ferruginibacter albus]UAY51231.1 DUF2252 domain-containing protein [Ferruginibacter albus]
MENISKEILNFGKDLLPDMLQYKYQFMTDNLYRFYRGTNHIFYKDLKKSHLLPSSPVSWISGDLHLENFGSFKGDNRLVYFDLNDFDEAVLAPCIYEVVKVVTSIFIAFQALNIEQKKALNMAELFLKTYSNKLIKGKADYIERNTAKGIVCNFLTAASERSPKELIKSRTITKNKVKLDHPKHFPLHKTLRKDLIEHITTWLKKDEASPYNYEVIDAAFRLAGTGSVGQKRYLFLLQSSNKAGEKLMLLDMKQSTPSCVVPYLSVKQPDWKTEADRIVSIQYKMQNKIPALLSTSCFKKDWYVMQEMQPTEDSINFKLLKKNYRDMYQVIDDMAMLTASSQLRSSGQQGSAIADELIEFGKDNKWQNKVLKYAIQYCSKVQQDYISFLSDYKKGVFKTKPH